MKARKMEPGEVFIKGPMADPHMNAATVELVEAARMWEIDTLLTWKKTTSRLRRAVKRYEEALLVELTKPEHQGK